MSPVIFPTMVFAIAAAAAWYFGLSVPSNDEAILVSIGSTIASVGATMLGFLLAALAVLASINHTHLVQMMWKTGHYRDLLQTIMFDCFAFFACMVTGLLIVFRVELPVWLWGGVLAIHAAAIASLLDVGRKLWLVLVNLNGPR